MYYLSIAYRPMYNYIHFKIQCIIYLCMTILTFKYYVIFIYVCLN